MRTCNRTRLAIGEVDPVTGEAYAGPEDGARLRVGDLLVVDDAGMLDRDTARAQLTDADEGRVRLALLGDWHQLAAVGRGGVLDLAARAVDPAAHLTLAAVHRFARSDPAGAGVTVPDSEYSELTLAMRTGADPGAVFDALAARGQIRLHANSAALDEAVAAIHHGAGETAAAVVDIREQAADLNAAIRERLVAEGRVDDTGAVITGAGQRFRVGARVEPLRAPVVTLRYWRHLGTGRAASASAAASSTAATTCIGGSTTDRSRPDRVEYDLPAPVRPAGPPGLRWTPGRESGFRRRCGLPIRRT